MPNAEQRANLAKLADYLIGLPADYGHFNMETFGGLGSEGFGSEDYPPAQADTKLHTCGTVACAAGHGPAAGIPPKQFDTWDSYIERSFGIKRADGLYWDVFSASLGGDHIDAGNRIKRVLEKIPPLD